MPKNYFKQTYFLKIFGWGENFLAQPGSSWFTRKFLVKPGIQDRTSWLTRKSKKFKTRYRNRNQEA